MREDTLVHLIGLSQAGHKEAESQLLDQYRPLACKLVWECLRERRAWYLDRDDLLQEALLGLVRAIRTYKADGGAGFAHYAWRVVQNALRNWLRDRSAEYQMYGTTPNGRDEPITFDPESPEMPDVASLLTALDAEHLDVIQRHYGLNGCQPTSARDLAKQMGVTKEFIHRRLREALDVMRRQAA